MVFGMLPATAQEMRHVPTLPQFGGLNGQALTVLQYEQQLKDRRESQRAAALREQQRQEAAAGITPTRRLIDSITNFINIEIARQFSNEILRGELGEGSLFVDGAEIRYQREDGFLSITVTDGLGGTTAVRVPLAFSTIPGVDSESMEAP